MKHLFIVAILATFFSLFFAPVFAQTASDSIPKKKVVSFYKSEGWILRPFRLEMDTVPPVKDSISGLYDWDENGVWNGFLPFENPFSSNGIILADVGGQKPTTDTITLPCIWGDSVWISDIPVFPVGISKSLIGSKDVFYKTGNTLRYATWDTTMEFQIPEGKTPNGYGWHRGMIIVIGQQPLRYITLIIFFLDGTKIEESTSIRP